MQEAYRSDFAESGAIKAMEMYLAAAETGG